MTIEPTSPTPAGEGSGDPPLVSDPDSAGPHDPKVEAGGWPAAVSTDRGRSDRVPDQDEIPAQTNPNAMAKAMLRRDQAH